MHIGTGNNEVDAKRHFCYIAGHFLEKEALVKHLYRNYRPDLSVLGDDVAHELRVAAHSYDIFNEIVKWMIDTDRQEVVESWNLDCVGKMKIPQSAAIKGLEKPFYRYHEDGGVIYVMGVIERGFASRLIGAINKHPRAKGVALGSGGGYVDEAIEAGRYIRLRGLNTTLWNGCYSACPLVFAGGVNRMIPSPYPVLGFHRISVAGGVEVSLNSEAYVRVARYLVDMDVDAKYVLKEMLKRGPREMNEVPGNDKQLCRSNLATWIQRTCDGSDFGHAPPK